MSICQDCVMQWLEANQALLKGKIDKCLEEIGLGEDIIPRGCRIISDDYLTIFLNLLLCRLQFTTIGVEMKFVKSCILQLLQELDRILQLFGHTPHTCANEWLSSPVPSFHNQSLNIKSASFHCSKAFRQIKGVFTVVGYGS